MPVYIAQRLLLLGTTTAGLLGELDALLVGLDVAGVGAAHHATEATSGLPGTLELANSGSAEEVDLDEVALESALEGDDGLDEKGVGVVEVKVHDTHHADTHELGLEQTAQLLLVVGVDGGGDNLGLLGAAHRGGLDVLHDGHVCGRNHVSCIFLSQKITRFLRTLLLVDLELDVEVDAGDEHVADDVESAHGVKDGRVLEGDLLADLHHHKDDHEVGAALPGQYGGRNMLVWDMSWHTFEGS